MIRSPCWDESEDLLLPMDKGQVPVLTHFDLPAAFDTVDHEEMWTCLRTLAGVDGVALEWSRSFGGLIFFCFLIIFKFNCAERSQRFAPRPPRGLSLSAVGYRRVFSSPSCSTCMRGRFTGREGHPTPTNSRLKVSFHWPQRVHSQFLYF